MHAAIYTRVSTDDQRDGASLDVQRERCIAYAEAQGWSVVAEFSDPGVSGAVFFEREQLIAALEAAQRGEVQILVAYNLDRFSRGIWPQLTEAAERAGLRLVTADGVIDTADDERELPADMYEAFAKEQRRLTVKKSMASRAARVRNGNWVGGVAPFGHSIEKGERGSTLVLNCDEQVIVLRAFALMLDENCSPGQTADRLNAEGFRKRGARWTSRNLIQTLGRSTLDGRFVYGKDKRAKTKHDAEHYGVKGHEVEVPRVVPRARFAAMQQLLAGVKWTKKTAHAYPLSRRIVTPDGHFFTGRWDTSNQVRRYRCAQRYEYSRVGAERGEERCSHREISAGKIERAVWDALMSELRSPRLEELFELRDAGPTDSEAAETAITRLTKQIAKLRKDRLDREARGLRDGYSKAAIQQVLDEIDQDIATAESELAAARSWAENAVRLEAQREAFDRMQEFASLMNSPDADLMARVFEAFDVRVTLGSEGNCEVEVMAPLEPGSEYLLADRRNSADV